MHGPLSATCGHYLACHYPLTAPLLHLWASYSHCATGTAAYNRSIAPTYHLWLPCCTYGLLTAMHSTARWLLTAATSPARLLTAAYGYSVTSMGRLWLLHCTYIHLQPFLQSYKLLMVAHRHMYGHLCLLAVTLPNVQATNGHSIAHTGHLRPIRHYAQPPMATPLHVCMWDMSM